MLGISLSTAIISREEVGSRAGLGEKNKNKNSELFWISLFLRADVFTWMGHKPGLKAVGRALHRPYCVLGTVLSDLHIISLIFTTLGRYYNLHIDKKTEAQRFNSLLQSPMAELMMEPSFNPDIYILNRSITLLKEHGA